MISRANLVVLSTLILLCSIQGSGQDNPSAAENVDNLKLELIEVKANEEMARLRVQELDEALKPENIQRALAGVGSTKPEELREQLSRQLSIEKTAVVAQLEVLGHRRSRLESAIATAEAAAYQQSASGSAIAENQLAGSQFPIPLRWLWLVGLVVLVMFGTSVVLVSRSKRFVRNK